MDLSAGPQRIHCTFTGRKPGLSPTVCGLRPGLRARDRDEINLTEMKEMPHETNVKFTINFDCQGVNHYGDY